MNCLNDDFLVKYFSINEKVSSLTYSIERRSGFFDLKTYDVKLLLERGNFTIDFFIKALIFSLTQKVIYRFLPENHIYCYDSIWYGYKPESLLGFEKEFIYKHKFSKGSDILIQNLSKRYGSEYDYTSQIDNEIDNYAEFTKTILFDELDPVCITSLKDSFSWIINHEEFKSEFSEDSLSFSNKFYNSLKSKL